MIRVATLRKCVREASSVRQKDFSVMDGLANPTDALVGSQSGHCRRVEVVASSYMLIAVTLFAQCKAFGDDRYKRASHAGI